MRHDGQEGGRKGPKGIPIILSRPLRTASKYSKYPEKYRRISGRDVLRSYIRAFNVLRLKRRANDVLKRCKSDYSHPEITDAAWPIIIAIP